MPLLAGIGAIGGVAATHAAARTFPDAELERPARGALTGALISGAVLAGVGSLMPPGAAPGMASWRTRGVLGLAATGVLAGGLVGASFTWD